MYAAHYIGSFRTLFMEFATQLLMRSNDRDTIHEVEDNIALLFRFDVPPHVPYRTPNSTVFTGAVTVSLLDEWASEALMHFTRDPMSRRRVDTDIHCLAGMDIIENLLWLHKANLRRFAAVSVGTEEEPGTCGPVMVDLGLRDGSKLVVMGPIQEMPGAIIAMKPDFFHSIKKSAHKRLEERKLVKQ